MSGACGILRGWFDGGMAEADEQGRLPLDYSRAGFGRRSRVWWVLLLLIAVIFTVIVCVGFLTGRGAAYDDSRNLRQIGQAIELYCIDHQGQFPDSFSAVLLNENIPAEVFVCPGLGDTPAEGATTQAVASNLLVPGHCSYIYIGIGLNSATVASNTVVAYESLANHGGAGMNVLFGDGHVEWVNAAVGGQIGAKVSAKVFPVTMPVN